MPRRSFHRAVASGGEFLNSALGERDESRLCRAAIERRYRGGPDRHPRESVREPERPFESKPLAIKAHGRFYAAIYHYILIPAA